MLSHPAGGPAGRQAFHLLTRASSHSNRKLRDIAEELTATGLLTDE
jgi:hypothetical protein